MKKFYLFSKSLLFVIFSMATLTGYCQNESSTANGNCGVITENFDNGTGGFSSKSLYTPDLVSDSEFYYNRSRGFWTEMGSDGRERTTAQGNPAPTAPRFVSILSATYVNPNPAGIFDVGFYYIVPNPQADLFHITLIRITQDGAGNTVSEVVAETGLKSFAQFSSPTPYTDPTNAQQNGFQGAVCIRLVDKDITSSASTYYRISVVYRVTSGTSFTAFDDFSIGGVEQVPLPVSFLGIGAKREMSGINLRWNVADETQLKEYQVERSVTGSNFTVIGKVSVIGTDSYNFTDANAPAQTAYYRIKSVDLDGKEKYSSIIKINANKLTSFSDRVKVYPIPALNEFTVEHGQLNSNAKIIIRSIDGRVIKVLRPSTGASHTPVNLSASKAGVYLLSLEDGSGKLETIRVIKN